MKHLNIALHRIVFISLDLALATLTLIILITLLKTIVVKSETM
jgi:hypothetical protein